MATRRSELSDSPSESDGLLEGFFGKPQYCDHCKKPFSFFGTKVKDFTFRSPYKIDGRFHPDCQSERVEIKKRKDEVLSQIIRFGVIRTRGIAREEHRGGSNDSYGIRRNSKCPKKLLLNLFGPG